MEGIMIKSTVDIIQDLIQQGIECLKAKLPHDTIRRFVAFTISPSVFLSAVPGIDLSTVP